MGAGSKRLHTVWLPWHDIDVTKGGLVVLEGSSSLPGFKAMRETYGAQQHGQWFGRDPAELLAFDPEARWVTANFRSGDLVLLTMLTSESRPFPALSQMADRTCAVLPQCMVA